MEMKKFLTDLLAPAVLPGDPLAAIPGVTEPVAACKLPPVPISMTTLCAHQRQEVQLAQVHLQIL